ncbi:MAG: FecR family protein [Prevotella sp.]
MNIEDRAKILMEASANASNEMIREAIDNEDCMEECRLINDVRLSMLMNSHVDKEAVNVDSELDMFLKSHRRRRWPLYAALSAAAAVIIAVLVLWPGSSTDDDMLASGGVYVIKACKNAKEVMITERNDSVIVLVPRGMTYKTTLPDGTHVTLNSDSKFRYPKSFEHSMRTAFIEGEAFFEVKKDAHNPFVVRSKNASVTVLGTRFNFKDYAMAAAEVTLYQGKVHLADPEGNISANMKPGQHAEISNTGKLLVNPDNAGKHSSWKDGCFYFDECSLKDIMMDIGRWYNVNVEFRDTQYLDMKCHFVADRNSPIEKIITLLNRMEKCHVAIINGEIVVN